MANYSTHSNRHGQEGQAQAAGADGKNYVDDHVEQVDRSPVGAPIWVDFYGIDVYPATLVVVVDIFSCGHSERFSDRFSILILIACIGCCQG